MIVLVEIRGMSIGILLYGQYGTLLSLFSFYALSVLKNSLTYKVFYLLGFVLGFVTIFISASRSPFLALLISMLVFSFLKNKGKGLIFIGIFTIIFAVFYRYNDCTKHVFWKSFLDRLLNAMHSENARIGIYRFALEEFVDNPVFGNAFLIQNIHARGSYPHNLIIEVLMATGIVGFIVFTSWWKNVWVIVFIFLRMRYLMFGFLWELYNFLFFQCFP